MEHGAIETLEYSTKTFVESSSEDKFAALQSICFLITTFGETAEFQQFLRDHGETWAIRIRDGLYDMFSNKVSKESMLDALFLTNWIMNPSRFTGAWAVGKPNLPLLLLQACRVEITLHLGGYERKKEEITSNSDEVPIIIKSREDQLLLVNCYKLVETCILCLVHEENGKEPYWSALPMDIVMTMQQIFFDIIEAIIQFLKRLQNVSESMNDSFVFATFKLFAVWSAEDPERYQQAFLSLLPLFFSLSPNTEDKDKAGKFIHVEIILPALSALQEILTPTDAELLLPHLIDYLIHWKERHNDMTDFLNDIDAYRAISLVDTLTKTVKGLPTQPIDDLLDLFRSFA